MHLTSDMLRARSSSTTSDPMDDSEYTQASSSASSSSVASTSPKMDSALPSSNYDLSYLLSLANSDLSSSSSESQSQGSRAASPSDWPGAPQWPQFTQDPSDLWKWNPDALIGDGIVDPGALMIQEFVNSEAEMYGPPMFTSAPAMQDLPSFNLVQPTPTYEQIPTPQFPIHPPPPPPQHQPHDSLPQDYDIASRARELTGVQYAVQANGAHPQYSTNPSLASLSIPQNSAYSTPSASSPMNSGSPEPASSSSKTPHTTIERRYRTNLNVRITALRHAIPALRHLEKDRFPNDKPDERGYIDGVKAARKASKGSIFGKATEYIRYVLLAIIVC